MKEMEQPIKILHLEDNESDSILVQLNLKREQLVFDYYFADNEQDFISFLDNEKIDIVLSDYSLPDYSGSEALVLCKNKYPHIPFVFVSGTMGEEAAIDSLLNGATDYVLKNRLDRLTPAVLRALRESKLQQEYLKAIDNLKQKEEQYRILVEGMNEGLMLTENNNTILFVNQQTCDITGFSSEELIGEDCHQLLFKNVDESSREEIEKLQKSGAKNSFEFQMARKNQEKIWVSVSCSPVLNSQAERSGLIGVFQDVTEKKKAEEEIRKLTMAIDQSPDSIVITDTEGKIEYINPATVKLTGYLPEELLGRKTNIFSSDENSILKIEDLWETIKAGKIWTGEFLNKKRNGQKYWESATISPIFNNSGKITHFLSIKEDISERKKLTEELIQAKEKAEESDRLKSAFLANISHEIRTPMNGILGFAELLKTPQLSQESLNRYIRVIEQSGYRMLNIINDIVDISKIEANQMNVYLESTNVNHLLKDLLVFFTPEAESKGLRLKISTLFPDEESVIHTDHNKLIQIFSNLIKNAMKFTKTGLIEFGYSSTSLSARSIASSSDLFFYVKDTGVGIPEDQIDMIFERFRQGSISLTRAYEGAGLGLSISKAFVQMLGGEIWVKSELGQGSEFYFTLSNEVMQTPELKVDSKDTYSNKKRKHLRILIAEDDESSMIYVKAILEREGTMIFEACNGKEAVDFVRNDPEIDLVLMDIKMPEMDGFEATRQIKRIKPSLPVIAQTAYAFVSDQEKAMEAGCDDYISKPIKKDILLAKIQKFR